jgi:SRSO17 transposase
MNIVLYQSVNEKRLLPPIWFVVAKPDRRRSRMVTIGKMPRTCKRFFRPVRDQFTPGAFDHFWMLVLAIAIGHGATIDRLARLLRGPGATHRTNHGDPRGFLWRSDWDESAVLRQVALDTLLLALKRKGGTRDVYLIFDDTQTIKRARKMQAVGKLHHHASGKYVHGHTIVKACLYVNGVIIPWGSWLYVKKEHCDELGVAFHKLTQIVAREIREAPLGRFHVTVLFDAFYLCPAVTRACIARGWRYIGVGKSNRCFTPDPLGRPKKLGGYGHNLLRRAGHWRNIQGLKRTRSYRIAARAGMLKGLGPVQVVLSRRRGERKSIALVTNDRRASATRVVRDYLKRWSIELLIKDEKQHLGLGDYRCWRYRAVVRHLHLVDAAHACLSRLALNEDEQGRKNAKTVPPALPPISQLKTRMRQTLWNRTRSRLLA